ncbi:heavy metal translocating P-type ATPase [Helicobacter sp. MIT 00-7814]|uniref:heavy metal translocating P-type ATPase n=1 Tax=unclassified Helicobacter TaxID=2593540 RepID=UPI000E1F4931|nr:MULTISPECIES: heavy metal translocating P-type ATPase [unclassified Helicobacter]RDU53449.1 heavy metal translocating P-type ATPase [Helicobacter sp. MIT 99-10781]RDU53746.1 heavy metal translocating P-type ATPase [Helicobacter sp. MIT 00-7814]
MQRQCSHCHLSYDERALKKVVVANEAKNNEAEELYFCCNGCEGVYFLLQKAKLQSFYSKLGATTLNPPKEANTKDLGFFESAGFKEKYIRVNKDGSFSCSLILEHIHCAACVWLNERILNNQKGIKNATINYTNNKLLLTWDNTQISLPQIITLIRSIGYDAYAYDPSLQESRDKAHLREYYIRIIVALFATMNIMWIAIAQYSGYFLGMSDEVKDILNLASFALCLLTLIFSGFVFYRGAYFGLKNGFIGMDLLVSVGATLTFFYSIYAAITHSGETYFESVSMILTFVLVGKFLEIRARKGAGESLDKLHAFLPQTLSVCENGDEQKLILKKPEEVAIGDVILALPGEKIALDSVLVSDIGIFDTKAINGESLPLTRHKGEELSSGFVNLNHKILYKAQKSFENSLMSKVMRLVEESLSHKPRIQNLANSISQNFSRTVLFIALLCFLGWHFVGGVSVERALIIAISVIIIACPCALALATPLASVVGIMQSYKKHIIFKQASFLEILAKANVVVFDKTGTLTCGNPQVETLFGELGKDDARLLYALVSQSKHPISVGVKNYLEKESEKEESKEGLNVVLEDFLQVDSQGIKAHCKGKKLVGGSLEFLENEGVKVAREGLNLGSGMLFGFGIDSRLVGVFELRDSLKSGAKELISYLRAQGCETILLSGDREQSVKECASALDIAQYQAGVSPLQKGAFIENLKSKGSIVVMAGDGINDALALSKSDIAISMGGGSDIALLSSDVVILNDSLESLQSAFRLAKRTFLCIKQNIGLSILYNALTIPIALAGLVIPLFAALSMSLSSLLVVLNSLRIK